MEKEHFERFLKKKIQLVNDENFCLSGKILAVYDNSIEFLTKGKIRILSFERVKEIRSL